MADSSSERIPFRLIICVDGTWLGPDGLSSVWAGNVSNIFRIWCSIKEGEVDDDAGNKWRQEKVYVKGIDNLSNWGLKLLSGALGTGIEQQIKDVYRMCAETASQPEDEIFFFGFSRGAFVVRAVANLLAYMRLPGPSYSEKSFDEVYEHILDLYGDVRSGNDSRKGAIHEYMVRCRPHPRIQFIGVLDTVKAIDDNGLYEFGLHTSHRHCRQALALNETNTALAPELWLSKEGTADFELRRASRHHSVQELWFFGSHGDLGGGNKQDGLALYPCQWLLSEARDIGLHLEFTPVTYSTLTIGEKATVDDPLELCFPSGHSEVDKVGAKLITSNNKMSTEMWDLVTTHSRAGYDTQINQRKSFWSLSSAPRKVFSADEKLIGHIESAPLGVSIHPSVYLLLDTNKRISSLLETWSFHRQLGTSRASIISNESQVWWKSSLVSEDEIDPQTKFRVLVCGDAGVGKSTLINILLGVPDLTQESQTEHGVHDIEQELSPEGARYIVHDSCGFQTGQQNEIERVKSFLEKKLKSGDFAERLHAILYCISATRVRTTESADEGFFGTLQDYNNSVPVIVVATRLDELEVLCGDGVEVRYMQDADIQSRRALKPEDWDAIEAETNRKVEEKKQVLADDFTKRQFQFLGPVFTSKRNKDTIADVVRVITDSLTTDRLRKMFVATQICCVQPKIDYALSHSMKLYSRAIQTTALPIAWSGLIASTTVTTLIVKHVLEVFSFNSFSSDMASQILSTAFIGNYESTGIYTAGSIVNAVAAGAIATGVGAAAGVAGWYAWKLAVIPQFGRLLLMCTVDTILAMEIVFWRCGSRAPEAEDIKLACELYQSRISKVHEDVKAVLPVWDTWNAFQFEKLKLALAKVIDQNRYKKE